MWVPVLTEFSDHLRIIELIVHQEILRILIRIYFYFCQCVMHCRDLVALGDS